MLVNVDEYDTSGKSQELDHKTMFNNFSNLLKISIQEHKYDSFNHWIATIGVKKEEHYLLWKVDTETTRLPPRHSDCNTSAHSEVEKTKTFAEHLKQILTKCHSHRCCSWSIDDWEPKNWSGTVHSGRNKKYDQNKTTQKAPGRNQRTGRILPW